MQVYALICIDLLHNSILELYHSHIFGLVLIRIFLNIRIEDSPMVFSSKEYVSKQNQQII